MNYRVKIKHVDLFMWSARIYRGDSKVGATSVFALTERGARRLAERWIAGEAHRQNVEYEYEVRT